MRRNAFTPFFLVASLILAVGLACSTVLSSPAEEPAPVAQPSPQFVPQLPAGQPQPTAVPPTPISQISRFFKENFDASVTSWSTFMTRGEANNLNARVENGYYVFELMAKEVAGFSLYQPENYFDVRLEVVADNRGVSDNNVSLICRYSEEGWYEASIANNGKYGIFYGKWDKSGKTASYAKVADGASNAIRTGKDVNTYGLICQGRTISLLINGKQIRSIDDNLWVLRDGQVGVGVSSFKLLPVRVEFDSIEISEP